MTLPLDLVHKVQAPSAPQATWSALLNYAWETCSAPMTITSYQSEIAARERHMGEVDYYLATAAWDLWPSFEAAVPRTAHRLAAWWSARPPGRAVLILDALSLREAPWLLQEADARGFTIHAAGPTGAELPADTTPFAKELGFGQRSALGNNGAGNGHVFPGARTESVDIAWRDCAALVGSELDWVFWHHFPDHRLHDHDDPGKGLQTLTKEIITHLTGDDFWSLVDRLATGRRLVITADHGYAASGEFTDADAQQSSYLKDIYKSGRSVFSTQPAGAWVPPLDLAVTSAHGRHLYVNGRRKWKSQGGYPTLTHGGLSILEVTVPYIELSRNT